MHEQRLTLTIRPEAAEGSPPWMRIDVVVSAASAAAVLIEGPEPDDPVVCSHSPTAADVREWAREQRIAVADVGRIPLEIQELYAAARNTPGSGASR